MLKSFDDFMENHMNNENDKWLENGLKSSTEIADDGFSENILEQIEVVHQEKIRLRKIILNISYTLAFALFIFIAPWGMMSEHSALWLNQLMTVNSDLSLPKTGTAILFTILLTGFVLMQESDG